MAEQSVKSFSLNLRKNFIIASLLEILSADFIYTIFSRCSILFSGLAVSILTAHYLGPAGRGNYFYFATLASLVVHGGSLGMHSSNLLAVARNPQNLGDLTSNSIWLALFSGFLFLLIVFLARSFNSENLWLLAAVTITGVSSLFYTLTSNLLVGIKKIKIFNLLQVWAYSSIVLGVCLAGFFQAGIFGFLAAVAISWLVTAVLLLSVLNKFSGINFKFNYSLFKSGLKFGGKIYFATLLNSLTLKLNVFILKIFADNVVLGQYSIAAQICDAIMILPATLALLLFSDLVNDPKIGIKRTQQAILGISFLILLVCVAAGLGAKFFISLIFGPEFAFAAQILYWMLPAIFFMSIISVASQYPTSLGYPKVLLFAWSASCALTLLLSLYLTPRYGACGAAGSLSISYGVLAVLVWKIFQTCVKQQTTLSTTVREA